MFINRPEYYGLTEDEDGNSTIGVANIIIAKHRNGAVGDVQLKFTSELAKFSDLERFDYDDNKSFGELPVNDEFDTSSNSGSITMPSRMDDDYSDDDDTPF